MYHVRRDADENPYAEEAIYQETKVAIDALERMASEEHERLNHTDRDGYDTRESRYVRCRSCGQSGYAGQHPFSTLGGAPMCDDCL